MNGSIIEKLKMSKLLYIKALARVERSKSTAVADAYRQRNPDDVIDVLNLFEESLPAFDGLVATKSRV